MPLGCLLTGAVLGSGITVTGLYVGYRMIIRRQAEELARDSLAWHRFWKEGSETALSCQQTTVSSQQTEESKKRQL